jgi:dodecin
MSVARITEISATSPQSFEDAVKQGIDRANQTVRHVKGAWIKEQQVNLDEGKVVSYQVNMQITFVLEDGLRAARRNVAPDSSSIPPTNDAPAETVTMPYITPAKPHPMPQDYRRFANLEVGVIHPILEARSATLNGWPPNLFYPVALGSRSG